MWTRQPKRRGDILCGYRCPPWTLVCRVRYADGGCTWELVPDQPIERDGHVARFLAAFETADELPPLRQASARIGMSDWRSA